MMIATAPAAIALRVEAEEAEAAPDRAATKGASHRLAIEPVELSEQERAWITDHPRIRVSFEPWPPFLLEENGRAAGITVDYLELICAELGIEVEWVHLEWSDALEAIRERRDVDVLPILTHNQEREEFLDFTDEYVSFPIVIFTREQAPFVGELDDLRDQSIAVERDYAMHGRLTRHRPDQPLVVVGTTEEALEAVATGRAQAYLGHLAVASYIIQRRGFSNLQVASSSPFGTHDQSMGVRRDWPVLSQLLDRGLAAVTPAGHAQIRQRWLTVRYEHGVSPTDIAYWVLVVLGTTGFILGLILLWNRRLSREVDERCRAEAALERSQAQLLEAQRISRIGSWTWDSTNEAFTWSAETFRLFDRDPSEKEPAYDELARRIHRNDRTAFAGLLRTVEKLGDRSETELRIRDTNGELRHLICRCEAAPTTSDRGGSRLVLGTFQDITDRKVMSEERRRMRDHIRHSQKLESLGVLAGGIAHDFNNILASIMGNAELAQEETDPDSEIDQCVSEVIIASRKAATLCQQMLAYAGQASVSMEEVELSAHIEASARMLTVAVSKKATMSFDLDTSLPKVRCDPIQMRQVLMNLVVNASESFHGKSGTINVSTRRAAHVANSLRGLYGADDLGEGDLVILEVRDDGAGMDKETCHRIFEPFFTTKFAGRGLGMAAVLGIVRSHGGAIRVSSTLGEGSTVTLYFPALPESDAEDANPSQALDHRTKTPETPRIVLVIDDEPQIRLTLERVLTAHGFEVMTAADGRRGVEHFRERSAELSCVVLDLIMPQIDGKEAFLEMQALNAEVPVVLMSGYNKSEIERRFAAGREPAAFIQKPFEHQSLLSIVEEVIEASLSDPRPEKS